MKITKLCISTLLFLTCSQAFAGGLFTNTNQNPVFFRQPAQNAIVGVQGAYYNPAGLTLMDNGWHFYAGNQMAFQSRQITSSYAPFKYGVDNDSQTTKKYEGKTFSPVIPSIDAVYTHDRWAASFHFGVVSGGGSCTFNEGLGSFESVMALLPPMINTVANSNILSGYDADIHFTGKSFGFGGQFNFAYKVIDEEKSKLSVAAGLRMNFLKNYYEGGIYNYQLGFGGNMLPASNVLGMLLPMVGVPAAAATQYAAALGGDKEVECTQSDIAWTPIISAHYRTGIVDLAVKYEFKTKVRYENNTASNTTGLKSFDDGAEVASDLPALLSAGFNVNVLPTVRVAGGYNMYFDKQANYGGKQDLLGKNTSEYVFGVEWDAVKKLTLSAGTQITRFDFGDNYAYLSDMSFSLNSWCLGGGLRYKFNDKVAADLSVFKTFYEHANKNYTDYGGAGTTYASALKGLVPDTILNAMSIKGSDEFYRTSFTVGFGVAFSF